MPKKKTKKRSAIDPIADANHKAKAWAHRDPADAFAAAVSDEGFQALTLAVNALEQKHTPESEWRWPGACDRDAKLDPAGSFRRRPWADAAAALNSVVDLVDTFRKCRTGPADTGWFWKPVYRKDGGACYGAETGRYLQPWTPIDDFPTDRADAVLVRALRTTPAGGWRSALAVVWQARTVEAQPFKPVKRASLARIERIERKLPGFPAQDAPDEPKGQLFLPGMGPSVTTCPSWLLWLFDEAGGQSMAQGRGAPWSMRLFIGAMLHLKVADRTGQWRTLRFPVEEVIQWLHPDGWANRRRDFDKFPAALDAMRRQLSYVPVPGVGSVAMMFPSVIPRSPSDPLVEFTIRIPDSAAHGARIDWPTLCKYGTDSASLYRAYLSATALLDRSAHKGHPITRLLPAPETRPDGKPKRRKGGSIVRSTTELIPNPQGRFVAPLTEADLARMIGLDPDRKQYRHRAREAFERMAADGVIELVREGKGFRLFGPKQGDK